MDGKKFIAAQVYKEAYAGRRCEICAVILRDTSGTSDANQPDGRCSRHLEDAVSEEMSLARWALRIREDLKSHILSNEHQKTWFAHESHASGMQRWADAMIFRSKCLKSLVYLAQPCKDLWDGE